MKNVYETVLSLEDSIFFKRMLKKASNKEILKTSGPFTLFVIKDNTFLDYRQDKFVSILLDSSEASRVLSKHIIIGRYTKNSLEKMDAVENLDGDKIKVIRNEHLFLADSKVVDGNIECQNGVIHIVDKAFL